MMICFFFFRYRLSAKPIFFAFEFGLQNMNGAMLRISTRADANVAQGIEPCNLSWKCGRWNRWRSRTVCTDYFVLNPVKVRITHI